LRHLRRQLLAPLLAVMFDLPCQRRLARAFELLLDGADSFQRRVRLLRGNLLPDFGVVLQQQQGERAMAQRVVAAQMPR
jgi:hypothetical protein